MMGPMRPANPTVPAGVGHVHPGTTVWAGPRPDQPGKLGLGLFHPGLGLIVTDLDRTEAERCVMMLQHQIAALPPEG